MPEPPAHWKINTTSPAFRLEGVWSTAPTQITELPLFFLNFTFFPRDNGKWLHLCQLPWNRCQCTVQAGAQGSVADHVPPQPDADGTAVQAQRHDFGPVQEEEKCNQEPTWVSHICDCSVSSAAHQGTDGIKLVKMSQFWVRNTRCIWFKIKTEAGRIKFSYQLYSNASSCLHGKIKRTKMCFAGKLHCANPSEFSPRWLSAFFLNCESKKSTEK